MGSLESNLLPEYRLDLSENHLANFQASRLRFEGRAPSNISTAYVARWEGPVLERDDPYPRPGDSPEGLRAVRHVQEVLFLPRRGGPQENAAIKWAVMQYGGVDATMAYQHLRLQPRDERLLLARHRARPPRRHRRLERRLSGRPLPAPPAGPRRLSDQEQLGHDLRPARLLLDLLLRPQPRRPARRVQRRRERAQPRRHLPARRPRLVEEHRLQRPHRLVRRAVHERRRRQRHRRELLHGQAGRDLRGPGRAVARRDRRGAGRRQPARSTSAATTRCRCRRPSR